MLPSVTLQTSTKRKKKIKKKKKCYFDNAKPPFHGRQKIMAWSSVQKNINVKQQKKKKKNQTLKKHIQQEQVNLMLFHISKTKILISNATLLYTRRLFSRDACFMTDMDMVF